RDYKVTGVQTCALPIWEIMREHANVKALLAQWNELSSARMQLADNRELANSTDADLAQMAKEEIPALEERVARLEREMQVALLRSEERRVGKEWGARME